MKFRDLTEPMGPRMCMFNVPYGDEDYSSGYDSGKEAGYEKAKKEYEEKLEDQRNELLARGFAPNVNISSSEVNKFVGDVSPMSFAPKIDPSAFMALCSDIPKQNNIPTGSKLCGYIEIDGTYHQCKSCEHEKNIRQIIWNNDYFRERYFNTPASFFDKMPRGMLQEEYFAMKDLGFVKISSFKDAPTKMIAFFYNTLTYKQTDLIYPR